MGGGGGGGVMVMVVLSKCMYVHVFGNAKQPYIVHASMCVHHVLYKPARMYACASVCIDMRVYKCVCPCACMYVNAHVCACMQCLFLVSYYILPLSLITLGIVFACFDFVVSSIQVH